MLVIICMVTTSYAQTNKNESIKRQYEAMELQKRPIYFPLPVKSFIRISSAYGIRKHPVFKKNKFHYGLDLVAKKGTPIYASAHGKVIKAAFSSTYGNYIIIDHCDGYKTLYAHMMMSKVKQGQTVKQGAVIGFVGSTGKSTGPHLHYEILRKNKKIDPYRYWMTTTKEWQKSAIAL